MMSTTYPSGSASLDARAPRPREEDPDEPWRRASLGALHWALGEREVALSHYDASIERDSQMPDVHLWRGMLLVELDRSSDAKTAFATVIELGVDADQLEESWRHPYTVDTEWTFAIEHALECESLQIVDRTARQRRGLAVR